MSDFIDHVWLIFNSIEYRKYYYDLMAKLIENAKSELAVNQSLATSLSSSCFQYLALSNNGWSLAVFFLPGRSSICGWPVPASLFLEDVVNLLKRLFALSVAQDIPSLEKYGSILLEFN